MGFYRAICLSGGESVPNHHRARPEIILQVERQNEMVSYTSGHQGDKMIDFIVAVLTLIFILGSIGPLLITDDVRDIVIMEKP